MILTDLPDGFHNDPWPHYAALRAAGAVRQPDGSVLLGRHADLEAIYKDPSTYRSDKKEVFLRNSGRARCSSTTPRRWSLTTRHCMAACVGC